MIAKDGKDGLVAENSSHGSVEAVEDLNVALVRRLPHAVVDVVARDVDEIGVGMLPVCGLQRVLDDLPRRVARAEVAPAACEKKRKK